MAGSSTEMSTERDGVQALHVLVWVRRPGGGGGAPCGAGNSGRGGRSLAASGGKVSAGSGTERGPCALLLARCLPPGSAPKVTRVGRPRGGSKRPSTWAPWPS